MTSTFSVASMNAFGAQRGTFADSFRLKALVAHLLSIEPHFICLQEVVTQQQADLLHDKLYYKYRCYHQKGITRNAGGLYFAVNRNAGFSVEGVSFSQFAHRGPRWHPLVWTDQLLGKGMQTILLAHRTTGKRLRILNTHLLAYYENMSVLQSTLAQKDEVFALARCGETPTLLCGDFNLHTTYMLSSAGFAEVFDFKSTPHTVDNKENPLRQGLLARLSGRGAKRGNKRIDYVLGRRLNFHGGKVIESPSVKTPISDHRGIYTGFAFA